MSKEKTKKTKKSRENMKILIATGIYPPDIGGPATYSKMLKDNLPERGVEVEVLSFGEVKKIPKILRHFIYFLKVFKKIRKLDAVFAQDTVSVGLPSCVASFLLNKKFFLRVPGDYAWEQAVQRFGVEDNVNNFQNKKYGFRTEFLKKIQRGVAKRADRITTPSKHFEELVSNWVDEPNKVLHIYNGIRNIEMSGVLYEEKEKVIISVGRLVPWKGFDALIELMKDLNEWKLVIIGDGPCEKELKERVEKLGVKDRVEFTGSLKHDELLSKLNEARIFVLNTSFENFSFQALEVMDLGIPVIVTTIPNFNEILEDGREGVLVEPDNKEEIKKAIEKIEADSIFRQSIVKNAKEKAKGFSLDNTLDKTADFLKEKI